MSKAKFVFIFFFIIIILSCSSLNIKSTVLRLKKDKYKRDELLKICKEALYHEYNNDIIIKISKNKKNTLLKTQKIFFDPFQQKNIKETISIKIVNNLIYINVTTWKSISYHDKGLKYSNWWLNIGKNKRKERLLKNYIENYIKKLNK